MVHDLVYSKKLVDGFPGFPMVEFRISPMTTVKYTSLFHNQGMFNGFESTLKAINHASTISFFLIP
jgi:hypothetical protein